MGVGSNAGTVSLETVGDVVRLLEASVRDVLQLENSVSRARCIGYLASVAVKALEVSSLEERIQRLEQLQGVDV